MSHRSDADISNTRWAKNRRLSTMNVTSDISGLFRKWMSEDTHTHTHVILHGHTAFGWGHMTAVMTHQAVSTDWCPQEWWQELERCRNSETTWPPVAWSPRSPAVGNRRNVTILHRTSRTTGNMFVVEIMFHTSKLVWFSSSEQRSQIVSLAASLSANYDVDPSSDLTASDLKALSGLIGPDDQGRGQMWN